jgi:drug/metabolite transporter (DMT)-like permease
VLAGALILREPLTARLLGALVFVGFGIYLVNRPAYRPVMPAGEMAVGDKN